MRFFNFHLMSRADVDLDAIAREVLPYFQERGPPERASAAAGE